MEDFWVFGYGSLMWNPGFVALESRRARMHGVHRALCVHSWVHRGTRERPGLVLGLDRGGSCHGVAFRASGEAKREIVDYLRARELVTRVYEESWRMLRLDDGRATPALTYLVDRDHAQYAGRLPDETIAATVRHSHGNSGANIEYVLNTLTHLREAGVRDPHLEAVGRLLAEGAACREPAHS
jgi:glutathione-specific gamma-glutamylcyclotransferase